MDECPVRKDGGLQRCLVVGIPYEAQITRGCRQLDNRGQSRQFFDEDPITREAGDDEKTRGQFVDGV